MKKQEIKDSYKDDFKCVIALLKDLNEKLNHVADLFEQYARERRGGF